MGVKVLESKSAWRPNFGSLKHGIWNNSWKNWGKIAAVFLVVYGIEAGYFAGLLYSSQYIRQQTYRALPTQYFGEFIRTANVYTWPIPVPEGEAVVFNPPNGCVEGETEVGGFVGFTEPDGIQTCPPTKSQLGWSIFPWVLDSNGLDQFPGCAEANGSTVITYQSSPAFTGEGIAAPGFESQLCQNFLFVAPPTANGTAAA